MTMSRERITPEHMTGQIVADIDRLRIAIEEGNLGKDHLPDLIMAEMMLLKETNDRIYSR